LPYISNCEGYGAYIPINKLISDPRCNFAKNPKSVSALEPGASGEGDVCDYMLKCIYDEDFLQNETLKIKWFQGHNPKNPLFYMSKYPLTNEEF